MFNGVYIWSIFRDFLILIKCDRQRDRETSDERNAKQRQQVSSYPIILRVTSDQK